MKYLDEYRDREKCLALARAIKKAATKNWCIMEICGGQTHSIVKYGIKDLLPENITLVHGPGCPVCVTSELKIDLAVNLAMRPGTVLFTYGDMLKVPGNQESLQTVRARGGKVRVLYSPVDAVDYAARHPESEIVFFAIGFETTAPANAMAIIEAHKRGLKNFSMLASHVLVPPAMDLILGAPGNTVQGFLAAGHVCTVMGFHQYHAIASKYHVPVIVTGFEPFDILCGILECVHALESANHKVLNQYTRVVTEEGNLSAQQAISNVFEICSTEWRGLGSIPDSGLRIKDTFDHYNAEHRFKETISGISTYRQSLCRAGEVLTGQLNPMACPQFGKNCTPEMPLGAPMVSGEGACAAYFKYKGNHLS